MDLVEFLTARLHEDEAAAHEGDGRRRIRMRREVEAKRAILSDYAGSVEWIAVDVQAGEGARGRMYGTGAAVALLAAVYADHPDYRQEWNL